MFPLDAQNVEMNQLELKGDFVSSNCFFQIEQHAVAHRAADVQQLRHDCEIRFEFETNRVESETEIKSWLESEETRSVRKRPTCCSRPETTTTTTATARKTNTQSSQTNQSKKSGETSAAACPTAKESSQAAATTTRSTTESFETKTGSESKPNKTET
jgi:hypothetical protein